jgi:hypothetical protein
MPLVAGLHQQKAAQLGESDAGRLRVAAVMSAVTRHHTTGRAGIAGPGDLRAASHRTPPRPVGAATSDDPELPPACRHHLVRKTIIMTIAAAALTAG